jgi:hypothetical protein
VIRDIWLLRLRMLLARAHGDTVAYRDYRDRYRAMAESLGFEGHIAWAEVMVADEDSRQFHDSALLHRTPFHARNSRSLLWGRIGSTCR